jgi:hypothetical protein
MNSEGSQAAAKSLDIDGHAQQPGCTDIGSVRVKSAHARALRPTPRTDADVICRTRFLGTRIPLGALPRRHAHGPKVLDLTGPRWVEHEGKAGLPVGAPRGGGERIALAQIGRRADWGAPRVHERDEPRGRAVRRGDRRTSGVRYARIRRCPLERRRGSTASSSADVGLSAAAQGHDDPPGYGDTLPAHSPSGYCAPSDMPGHKHLAADVPKRATSLGRETRERWARMEASM